MTVEFTAWPQEVADIYRDRGYWIDENLQDILSQRSLLNPNKVALVSTQGSFTYAELEGRSNALAHHLAQKGVEWGDTALVHLPNSAEFYIVFWSLLKLGVVAVNALFSHNRMELEAYAEQINPNLLIVSERHSLFKTAEGIDDFKVRNPGIRLTLLQSDILNFSSPAHQSGLETDKTFGLPKIAANDVALFQLSGGSTGVPKLIPRTHNDYHYSVRRSAEICELDESVTYLCVLPAQHNFPLSSPGALGIWYRGGTVVVADDPSPQCCFPLIAKHRVTLTSLVPPLLDHWLSAAKQTTHDLSSLKLLQVGGAKLNPDLAARAETELNVLLQQVFGMAEGLVNYTRLDDNPWHRHHTQGRPMSEADEIKVIGPDGLPVETGEVGSLLTRGPYTIRGYYKAEAYNRLAFDGEGFYRTGDLVRMTDEGYLVATGRDKDQINRGGEKIAAEELETLLMSHADIRQAAVVAMHDRLMGEKICAFLICQDTAPKAPSLRKFLREKGLAEYKLPDRFEVLFEFPLTAVGKIDKKKLRSHIDTILQKSEDLA